MDEAKMFDNKESKTINRCMNRNKKQNILTMKKAKSKNVDDKESKNKNESK